MLDLDIDLSLVETVENGGIAWVAFSIAHRRNVSEDTKRAMLTSAIMKGLVSMHVGTGKGWAVWSNFVRSCCIDEFFRACRVFKERPRDMPREFIIGRTNAGNLIRIVINGEFIEPMCGMTSNSSAFF